MNNSDAKTAEFARLFDLFERLASRRARSINGDASKEDIRSLPIPEELAPVIKSLSNIVYTRNSKTRDDLNTSRPRRNTVASTIHKPTSGGGDESDDDEDEESLAKFPLGKKYPFTFKLMVHKLYKVEEWARTVKEMLEKSKNEFKTLAEQEAEDVIEVAKDQEMEDVVKKSGGAVHFQVGTNVSGGNRGKVGGRQRSQSVVTFEPKAIAPTSPLPKSPGSGNFEQPDVRALKKRCVGRRKSMSGPLNGDAATGRTGGSWVYNAAISASERPIATTFAAFPPGPPPSPTSQTGFGQYQRLAMMGGSIGIGKPPLRGGMKRRVSAGNPGSMMKPLATPFQQVNMNTERISARRRALTVTGMKGVEETQRKQMKRPYAG
ncbi:hypothetical protein B0H34DRAFT_674152 [Crassisporium funariophilum]|nr:hypothetical protein B0H34DRAFT_674152 [Crassisporium funariophilum]